MQEVFGFVKKNRFGEVRSAAQAGMPLAEKGVRGKGRQPLSPLSAAETSERFSARLLSAPLLAHGIAAHFDAMGVVNQPVQYAVSSRGVADLFVPARDR